MYVFLLLFHYLSQNQLSFVFALFWLLMMSHASNPLLTETLEANTSRLRSLANSHTLSDLLD